METTRFRIGAATILALTLGVAGCSTYEHAPPPSMTLETPRLPANQPYILGPGDLVTVKFYHNPEMNEDVVIRPDGMITLQLIGDVKAADQTPGDLATTLAQRYSGELAKPAISVIVRTLSSARVYVGGEVAKPGVVPLSSGLTAFQAIQEAGSFLSTARRTQVILVRRGLDGQVAGYTMDLLPVVSGEHPERDVSLEPLDVVYVPKSAIADVNLFIEKYIRNNLPTNPGFAIPF